MFFAFKQDVRRDESKMAVLALNFFTCNSVSFQGEQIVLFMKRHIIIRFFSRSMDRMFPQSEWKKGSF